MLNPSSPYYYTPQDIGVGWQPLVDHLLRCGGPGLLTLNILLRDGCYAGWVDPVQIKIEGGLPVGDGRPWWSLIRRFQAEAVGFPRGLALGSCMVYVDGVGAPVFWTPPTIRRVEPKRLSA